MRFAWLLVPLLLVPALAHADCPPKPLGGGASHFDAAESALKSGDEKTALALYTSAIRAEPTKADYYAALADLYLRLGFTAQAEQTLFAGEAFVKDEPAKFPLYVLHGQILEEKRDVPGAVARYESAKKACGTCSGPGQHVIYFLLGAGYASLTPPRKSEAMAQLQSFQKLICKGAAAARYADHCIQAQQIAVRLGGALY